MGKHPVRELTVSCFGGWTDRRTSQKKAQETTLSADLTRIVPRELGNNGVCMVNHLVPTVGVPTVGVPLASI